MNSQRYRRESGIAAVELAIIIPVLFTLFTAPLFLAYFYYHHTVVNKASYGAARYLATVRKSEMKSPDLVLTHTKFAKDIAREMLTEVGGQDLSIQIDCDNDDCLGGPNLPTNVEVFVTLRLIDPFGFFDSGDYGIRVSGRTTMRYAGQ